MNRRTIASFMLALWPAAAGTAYAQSVPPASPITPAMLFAGTCGVILSTVQRVEGGGRYLLTFKRREESPNLPVVVRIDDRAGHWLYPPIAAAQAVVSVPASAEGPLNAMVYTAHDPSAGDVGCGLHGRPITATAPVAVPSGVDEFAPASYAADAPATCVAPFVPTRPTGSSPRPTFTPELARIPWTVVARVDIAVDGSVSNVTVLAATNPEIAEVFSAAARTATFSPEIFRCEPVTSYSFLSAQHTATPR